MGGRGAEFKAISVKGKTPRVRMNTIKTTKNNLDTSKYAKKHDQVIDFVKKQTNLDLNKYRTFGDSASNTSHWDKNGYKVAIDLKGMSKVDKNTLLQLAQSYNNVLTVEQGGAWIGYVSFTNMASYKIKGTK